MPLQMNTDNTSDQSMPSRALYYAGYRPTRPAPLRLSISKPIKASRNSNGSSNILRSPTAAHPVAPLWGPPPTASADSQSQSQSQAPTASKSGSNEGASKSGMGCGRGGGGMETSFTWLDSVNSTMDEVKSLIVKRKVHCLLILSSYTGQLKGNILCKINYAVDHVIQR